MPQWDIRSCKANVCQFQCQYQLEGHSVERMYLRQSCSHGSRWIKPLNHASLQRLAPNTCTLDFPDAIKSRVAAHTTSEKAIRFRHTDYNPDRAQKLISSSMPRHLSTRNISSKSMHAFFSNLANRQTDRHGQKHLPPHLSEVMTQVRQIYHITLSHERYFATNVLLRFSTLVLCRSDSNCARQ